MSPFRRRHWVVGSILIAFVTVAAILVGYRIPLSSERLRREVIATLSERLESEVELDSIAVHPFPRLRVVGSGLVIKHKRHREVPLIAVQTFTVQGDLLGLLRKHVAVVTLEGLAIQIPPGDKDKSRDEDPPPARRSRSELVIDELIADGSTLTLIPREAEKRPKVWRMKELRMQAVGLTRPMPFHSILTNAVPPGQIDTTGTFGPWDADEPGDTPVSGGFTFNDADLSVFKGIAGILSSRGDYDGTLGSLKVTGQTTTPDFMVRLSGHPVHLETQYQALVDGTSGDTTLERIDASFLNTAIVATGGVYRLPLADGREVKLDIDMSKARLEDVLMLAVKTPKPPMTGALALKTRFELPPGDRDVVEKLLLDGEFTIEEGRFTDAGVQQKINTLSGKASQEKGPRGVTSDFRGTFTVDKGRLALSPLRFTVPGALVEVRGSYGLRTETLAFAGQLLMDAKVSEMVDGWKSILLKPFDPLFSKGNRTFIPLTIGGTRHEPKFGLDKRRVFNKDAAPVPPKPSAAPPRPRRPAARSTSAPGNSKTAGTPRTR